MERKNVTVMIALDLFVAFDTVEHKVLLSNLQNNFGISGTTLEWFRNYLNHRDMTVKIGKSDSERKELTFSVLQGSCLEQTYLLCIVIPSGSSGPSS